MLDVMSALVVEDEPAILRIVTAVLHSMGCETLSAPDAETASELVESRRPDFIIVDVRLPGMDGVQFARNVRLDERLAATPIVIMSAYGEPKNHPGDAFLSKPFDIDHLEAMIRRYLPRTGHKTP